MAICDSCGGVIGRDCFNTYDCARITESMNIQDYTEPLIELLADAKRSLEWVADNMSVDNPEMQETYANMIDNLIAQIKGVLPSPPKEIDQENNFLDDLPF